MTVVLGPSLGCLFARFTNFRITSSCSCLGNFLPIDFCCLETSELRLHWSDERVLCLVTLLNDIIKPTKERLV